jgi:hypothetical protein
MNRRYFCPQCHANLNPNVKIILMARRTGEQGLILLSPQPGNYEVIVADELRLQSGDLVEFHCPVCSTSITSNHDETMAKLVLRLATGAEGKVYFARRFGEHATYFVVDDEVQSFGENAMPQGHLNFFGSGQDED